MKQYKNQSFDEERALYGSDGVTVDFSGPLSEAELHARYIAKAEQYAKLINIEAM